MSYSHSLVALALAGALLCGACEKQVREARSEPAEPAPTVAIGPSEPTIAPAAEAQATTASIETQPVAPTLLIDGMGAVFPPTKLLLHHSQDSSRMTAELFSHLPRSALRQYAGNELYLEMKLQGASEPTQLEQASWQFKSTSSGKADSVNGIFLNGQSTHLQPDDVLVTFHRQEDGQLFVQITGQFRAYESGTPEALAPFVHVSGELPIELVQKR